MKDDDHPIPQIYYPASRSQLEYGWSTNIPGFIFMPATDDHWWPPSFFPYTKPMEKYGEPWKMGEPITLVVHAHIGDVERKEWLLAKMGTWRYKNAWERGDS